MPRLRKAIFNNGVYFLTLSAESGIILPANPLTRFIVGAAMLRALKHHPIRISHYIVNGTHIHMIVRVWNPEDIPGFMERFKTESAHYINRVLGRSRVSSEFLSGENLGCHRHLKRSRGLCYTWSWIRRASCAKRAYFSNHPNTFWRRANVGDLIKKCVSIASLGWSSPHRFLSKKRRLNKSNRKAWSTKSLVPNAPLNSVFHRPNPRPRFRAARVDSCRRRGRYSPPNRP